MSLISRFFSASSLRSHSIYSCVIIASILLTSPTIGHSQSIIPDHDKKIKVMILGTSHFGNPGQDVINTRFPDVLKPKYQKQIDTVLDSLSEFSPTKIALEVQPDYKVKFDSLYQAYIEGQHQLTRNERQQLGFRLGKRFEHPQLYSIDHKGNFPFREVIEFAKKHNPEFISYFESIKNYVKSTDDSLYSSANIREILRFNNSPNNLQIQRNYYAQTAAVGADSTWVGANLVAEWHHRNIKIFGDLASIAKPGDRIIVIFGTGHAPLLRYFVESSLKMKLIEPNDYL